MLIVETCIGPTQASSQTATLVGRGSYMALGARKALMAQKNSDESIRVYIALTVPETWAKESGLDWSDIAGTKKQILRQYFEGWAVRVTNLVTETGLNEMRLWPLYDTPKPSDGGSWQTELGVSLIGDAAHVMPPWTGRGVNMALLDGLELGKRIGTALRMDDQSCRGLEKPEVLQKVLQGMRDYEREMWTRMDREKDENRQTQGILFADDSPQPFLKMMEGQTLAQT